MPSTLTGSPADPTTAPQATGPSSGDSVASAAMDNSALQPLLNYIAWLRLHGAVLDASNTFSQSATFNAAVTIAALLTLSGNDLNLTKSGLQSILKGGSGKLDIGTSTANDLEFLVNGVVKAILRASDGKLQGQSTGAGDSATTLASKDYVDSKLIRAEALLGLGAGGTVSILSGFGVSSASYSAGVLNVTWSTPFTNGQSYIMLCQCANNASPLQFLTSPLLGSGGSTGSVGSIGGYTVGSGAGRSFANGDIVAVMAIGS